MGVLCVIGSMNEVTHNRFKDKLEGPELNLAVRGISLALTKSLISGYFIDPYTMDKVDLTGCLFSHLVAIPPILQLDIST